MSNSSDTLVVTAGPLTGRTLPLERRELVLGRDDGCDIPLTSYVRLSRRHARLTPTTGGWKIEDLGSTNGVLLDGQRVQQADLRQGSVLKLGDFEARVELVQQFRPGAARTVVDNVPPQGFNSYPPSGFGGSPSGGGFGGAPPKAKRPKTPMWVWGVVGLWGILTIAGSGIFISGNSSPSPTPTASTSNSSDDDNSSSDDDTPSPGPAPSMAPPVNGRIAPSTIAIAKHATVLIEHSEGTGYVTGSGFVTGNGHQIVTNKHVVTTDNGVSDCEVVFDAGTPKEREITVPAASIELSSSDNQVTGDLAIMTLPDDDTIPTALQLGKTEDVNETDTTWVFGFPLGDGVLTVDKQLPSVSVKAASVERVQRGQVDGNDAAEVLQLGSTVTHGNSGGPVLNAEGEVVGVIVAVAISSDSQETGMCYAIPTVWVKQLLK